MDEAVTIIDSDHSVGVSYINSQQHSSNPTQGARQEITSQNWRSDLG